MVKVFTTVQAVDFYEPWKPGSESHLEGCGCVVSGERILTTAEMVNLGNYIEIQKFGETKRYVAKVEQLGYDLNLALLSVEDKSFFKDTEPVEFGEVPSPGDKIMVYGGDELSVKEDTVSGLDMVWSSGAARQLPILVTHAQVESKDKGCPVFREGKFIGLSLSSSSKTNKSGEILPVNVVERFFKGFRPGHDYNGFPDLGVYTQNLENSSLQNYYKLPPEKTGVVVTRVLYGGSADGRLKEGDILTSIDGHPIDNEGYINLQKTQRVPKDYVITFFLIEEEVSMDIFRDGQPLKIQVPLKPLSPLVDYRPDNRHPTYFMIAGFIFTPLTYNYLQSAESKYLKPKLKALYYDGLSSPERTQVVLMSHVLPHDVNNGYEDYANLIVEKVNGHPIKDMKDLITAFDNPSSDYHVIETDDHAWSGSRVVFDAKKSKQATEEVMATFKIPADRSNDLK